MLLPVIHRHSLMALALLVFSQSFSPLMKYRHSRRVLYNPSSVPSSSGASSPANVWNIMIIFTSKSLSLVEESSSDLPKFDSAFAEAIGKPFKRWTEENIGETKKKLLAKKTPPKAVTDKSQTMSKDLQQTTSTVSTDVKKVNEISRGEAKPSEQKLKQLVEEEEAEEDEELKLHPESLKYREEQLNKQWKQLQSKIQHRLQTRSFINRLTLSKEVKEVEEFILNKPIITEKEYKTLLKKEHKIMKQLLLEKGKDSEGEKKPLQELLDLFPEVKSFLPKFAKKEDGGLVLCTSDEDCPFPLTCCPGFRQTGERFCCSGWGERVMTPAYVMNPLVSSDQSTSAPKDSGYLITPSHSYCPQG